MKNLYSNTAIALLLGLLLFTSCQRPTDQQKEGESPEQSPVAIDEELPKGKLFIIGGGKRPPSLVKQMMQEANLDEGGHIIVLPMSSSEPDTAMYYGIRQFTELGVENIAGFNFKKGKEASQVQLDSLKSAALIYITGGDQNRFMDVVAGTSIESGIRACYENGGMIAGTSAGAAVMSEKMITGNEIKYPDYSSTFRNIESKNIELGTGLGFLKKAIIDQHFVKRSRYNRLLSAAIEHPDLLGVGIDESTAIVVEGKTAKVVGESQVVVFHGPEKHKEKEGKMGATGLRLDIHLAGDTFSIR